MSDFSNVANFSGVSKYSNSYSKSKNKKTNSQVQADKKEVKKDKNQGKMEVYFTDSNITGNVCRKDFSLKIEIKGNEKTQPDVYIIRAKTSEKFAGNEVNFWAVPKKGFGNYFLLGSSYIEKDGTIKNGIIFTKKYSSSNLKLSGLLNVVMQNPKTYETYDCTIDFNK